MITVVPAGRWRTFRKLMWGGPHTAVDVQHKLRRTYAAMKTPTTDDAETSMERPAPARRNCRWGENLDTTRTFDQVVGRRRISSRRWDSAGIRRLVEVGCQVPPPGR